MDHITKLLRSQNINEITFRYSIGVPYEKRQPVPTSMSAYELLKPLFLEAMDAHEVFWLLLLDRGNRCKGAVEISRGGLHGTVADPKIIFGITLRTLSCSIVVAHNHPSGQLRPSQEDIALTRKLKEGGQLLDIALHDHLIVTAGGYYSFADNGML